MTSPLGYMVLARRPGQPDEPISAVFPGTSKGLEQAQNVVESRQAKYEREWATWNSIRPMDRPELAPDPVEYVIGEITEVRS